jgi:hypothetical protein
MDEFVKRANDLIAIMWKTAGSRFLAASRLQRRDRLSTFTIALLSAIAIVMGLVEPHVGTGVRLPLGLTTGLVSAAMSLFILVISLVEGGGQTAVQCAKLHDNAVQVAEVRRNLEDLLARAKTAGSPDWAQYEVYRDAYYTHLRACPFNHEVIDFLRFEANHRKDAAFSLNGRPRIGWLEAQGIKLRHLLSAAWLSFASWALVLGLVGLVVGGVG